MGFTQNIQHNLRTLGVSWAYISPLLVLEIKSLNFFSTCLGQVIAKEWTWILQMRTTSSNGRLLPKPPPEILQWVRTAYFWNSRHRNACHFNTNICSHKTNYQLVIGPVVSSWLDSTVQLLSQRRAPAQTTPRVLAQL